MKKIFIVQILMNLLLIGVSIYLFSNGIERYMGDAYNYWRPVKTIGDVYMLSSVPTLLVFLLMNNVFLLIGLIFKNHSLEGYHETK